MLSGSTCDESLSDVKLCSHGSSLLPTHIPGRIPRINPSRHGNHHGPASSASTSGWCDLSSHLSETYGHISRCAASGWVLGRPNNGKDHDEVHPSWKAREPG